MNDRYLHNIGPNIQVFSVSLSEPIAVLDQLRRLHIRPRSVVLISDCQDFNAKVRQEIEVRECFGVDALFCGVPGDLGAALCLVDCLARFKTPSVVLANVAPRGKESARANGSPFGFFLAPGGHLVVSTFEGYTLDLVRKLGLMSNFYLVDELTTLTWWAQAGWITEVTAERVGRSQFRSLEFAIPLAGRLWTDRWSLRTLMRRRWRPALIPVKVPAKVSLRGLTPPSVIPPGTVCWQDNFGNLKTGSTAEEICWKPGRIVTCRGKPVTCYPNLGTVPNGQPGLTLGSSGYENNFVELVVKGDSAARYFNLSVGDSIF